MRFDWKRFCEQRGIHYDTQGPNVSKENINITCPWCGAADRSRHMGLHLDPSNPVFGCLRNAKHRGKNPARLVAQLLGIRFEAAAILVAADAPPIDDFEGAMSKLKGEESIRPAKEPEPLAWPHEIRLLRTRQTIYAETFIDYLARERGFGSRDALELIAQYDLRYALTGEYAYRLIFPIYRQDGFLSGWTGRSVYKRTQIRYLTSPNLPKDALLFFSHPEHTRELHLICEGPLDALKLDYYGKPFGIRAFATMGAATSPEKVSRLRKLGRTVPLCVIFDSDATGTALGFADEIGAPYAFLPEGVKDPGELSPQQARNFLAKIAAKDLHSSPRRYNVETEYSSERGSKKDVQG